MTLEVKVNLNSLRIVRDELFATIDQAATELEAYMLDRKESSAMAACVEKLSQVAGALKLLELPAASLLGAEMAAVAVCIEGAEKEPPKAQVDALTHGFFVLPHYLDYIAAHQCGLPVLIVPYINELRVSRREPLLPESCFYHHFSVKMDRLPAGAAAGQRDEVTATGKRLLQMYQAGLVGVLKENRLAPHVLIMSRAVSRIRGLLGGAEWTLMDAALQCFAGKQLELTFNRKRMLAEIEKRFREAVSGKPPVDTSTLVNFYTGMLFVIWLTPDKPALANNVCESQGLAPAAMTDVDIVEQRRAMNGPGSDTIESVIKSLYEELRSAKEVLEVAAQNNAIESDDLKNLMQVIRRVADTLTVLNLAGPRSTLLEQLEKVAVWENNSNVRTLEFLEVADAILFVESSLSGLDRKEISVKELNEASVLTRKRVIASSHLAEAERLVLAEAESGIALAKRAITAYVDSNYDVAHIANLATTLNTVRGGLQVLGYGRAADVLKNCGGFISAHMKQNNVNDQRHQLLETLADALISLEYYISEVMTTKDINEKILEVAEESLAALGFGSAKVN